MGRKKVNQLMQSDNGLIAELADVKWIKQPVIYSMITDADEHHHSLV